MTKYLSILSLIFVLPCCGLQDYSSRSVEASNGLYSYQTVNPTTNKSVTLTASSGQDLAAERARKAEAYSQLPR